jgi:hypothetical protein
VADLVTQLFEEYAGRFTAGERPDLRSFLDRAGDGREELAELVDAFLLWAEAPDPDDDAVALAQAWLDGEAPLVALRVRRGVRREDVVDAIVARFGLAKLRGKVERRYHELETGQIDPRRADPSLLEEVAAVLRTRVADLLAWRPRPLAAEAAYFRSEPALAAPPPMAAAPQAPVEARDQVDRLFLGDGA